MSDKISIPNRNGPSDGDAPKTISPDATGLNRIDDQRGKKGAPSSAGFGVEGGIPYGEQLAGERLAFDQQHMGLQGAGRLRAATRKALGRG